MADLSPAARDSVAKQHELFRRADAEEGLSINVLYERTPSKYRISKSTMRGWKAGAAMPAWAIGALGEAGVPDHLLSLVLAPYGRRVMTEDEGEGDLDTAADEALDFAHEVQKARSPKSPGGIAIVPQEAAVIQPKRQRAASAILRAA